MYDATFSDAPDCAQQYRLFQPGETLAAGCCVPPPAQAPGNYPVPMIIPQLALILDEVAARHGVKASEIRGYSRGQRIARPRHEFVWIARSYKLANGRHRFSTTQIGRFLGNRDHTTVISSFRRHEKLMRDALIERLKGDTAFMVSLHGGR